MFDMIDYLIIRDSNFVAIGVIDTANSIIWHKKYYSVGDFEIFVQATAENVNILQLGNFVTRADDDEIGIIERIEISQSERDGLMIVASGRFAKSLLDRRIIYTLSGKTNKATILTGNVESAARALVANNAISCGFNPNRNMSILRLGAHSGSTKIIVDDAGQATQKQVTNDNLLTYSDALLEEYNMSAKIVLSSDESKLKYVCYEGVDRSMNNSNGLECIIFSNDFDNLTDSDYLSDNSKVRNMALIGGEGEGLERFYSAVEGSASGISRRELFIDASSISQEYKDDQEQTHTYTDEEYAAMLNSRGKLQLAQMIQIEAFSGTINTELGTWRLGRDYTIGDIVTIQDNQIGVYANVRITETTEVQDENGYSVSLDYE